MFDKSLMFVRRTFSEYSAEERQRIGKYEAKYYSSTDKCFIGIDGQHLRTSFDDNIDASFIELFPLAEPVENRYDDYFQRTYGRIVLSNKNILYHFGLNYNYNLPELKRDRSVNLMLFDYNVLYSEKSKRPLNSAVLGQNLVVVLDNILNVMKNINKEVALHVHPNVSVPTQYRLNEINSEIDKIKDNLKNILSETSFVN